MSINPVFKPLIRFFNQITDHGDFYVKSSINQQKLKEEFTFLSTIPKGLQSYYPVVSDFQENKDNSSYKIIKIPVLDASHLLISGQVKNEKAILNLLNHVHNYLKLIPSIAAGEEAFRKSIVTNVYEKNLVRVRDILALNEISQLNDICKSYGFETVHEYCLALNHRLNGCFLGPGSRELFYSHGDMCFSNILPTSESFFLIDPKGYKENISGSYRIIHYDLAKLSQSLLGSYDLINHELFNIENNILNWKVSHKTSPDILWKFNEILNDFQVELMELRVLEASLFLSLIPYHMESSKKMKGFLINSLNIFNLTQK